MRCEVTRDEGSWVVWLSGVPEVEKCLTVDNDEKDVISLTLSVISKRIKHDVTVEWVGMDDSGKRLVRKINKESS